MGGGSPQGDRILHDVLYEGVLSHLYFHQNLTIRE